MDDKRLIRSAVLARRDELTAEERSRKSLEVCRQLERMAKDTFSRGTEAGLGADTGAGAATDSEASANPDGGGCEEVAAGVVTDAAARADADGGEEVAALAGGRESARRPRVAVYAAMRSEVVLDAFVEAAYARGWDVCFPCMVRDKPDAPSRMAFYRVSREQLTQARAAFLDCPLRCLACDDMAAKGYVAVDPCDLDAVVVPLVAFDNEGRRLGYGGGNYDRLLPLLHPDALVVGVAFEEQRVPAVPTEPHDQPLPRIVCA